MTAPAYDPGLDQPPTAPQPPKLAGVDLDPVTGPQTQTSGPLEAQAKAKTPQGGLSQALQGLRMMQPQKPVVPATPAAPHADPRGLNAADPLKMMQLLQALASPGSGPMLAQLLGGGR